jgi:hypothetical protein
VSTLQIFAVFVSRKNCGCNFLFILLGEYFW